MKKILHFCFVVLFHFTLYTQNETNITLHDDSKVGVVVSGTGNTINTTQIFSNSIEFNAIKKNIENVKGRIEKKRNKCILYKEQASINDCYDELNFLYNELDSLESFKKRYTDEILSLAKVIAEFDISSEKVKKSIELLNENKYEETAKLYDIKSMKLVGDSLLTVKHNHLLHKDSLEKLLVSLSNEFDLLANLKLLDFHDVHRIENAIDLFDFSIKYSYNSKKIIAFGRKMIMYKKFENAINFFTLIIESKKETAEKVADLKALIANCYSQKNDWIEAENNYLESIDTYEFLYAKKPSQYELKLSKLYSDLGHVYKKSSKMDLSEKYFLKCLQLRKDLFDSNPQKYGEEIASILNSLGSLYSLSNTKKQDAENMLLMSVEVRRKLAKIDPKKSEDDLARSLNNLGVHYFRIKEFDRAEENYIESLKLRENLFKLDSVKHLKDLGLIYQNLGVLYTSTDKHKTAQGYFDKAVSIFMELSLRYPNGYLGDYAYVLGNSATCYSHLNLNMKADSLYNTSIIVYNKLISQDFNLYASNFAKVLKNTGVLHSKLKNIQKSNECFKKSESIYEKLIINQANYYENDLAFVYYEHCKYLKQNMQIDSAMYYFNLSFNIRIDDLLKKRNFNYPDFENLLSVYYAIRDSFQISSRTSVLLLCQQNLVDKIEIVKDSSNVFNKLFYKESVTLIWFYLNTANSKKARFYLKKCTDIFPSENILLLYYGHSFFIDKEYKKAMNYYSEFIDNSEEINKGKKRIENDIILIEKDSEVEVKKITDWLSSYKKE